MKMPFVAATALFVYNNKPELGTELLNKAATALQKYIDSGSWREVKLLVRFLGCLQPLYEGDGIFTLLEELFARAVDLQTASSEDVSLLAFLKLEDHGSILTMYCGYSCSAWSSSRSSSSPFLT
jgi:nuclear cap-binding protein subunit 1